jgi:hypothetical protein
MKKFIKMLPMIVAGAFVLQMGAVLAPAGTTLLGNNSVVSADEDIAPVAETHLDTASKKGVCDGIGLIDDDADTKCTNEKANQDIVGGVLKTAITLFSMVVGVISVIMIIVGGLKYIISMGDGGNVKSAKDTILYAIIGLVIVVMAQIIVRFVLTSI